MLRLAVMAAAAIWVAVAAAMTLYHADAWPMLLVAALFLLGTAYERFHYRGAREAVPGPGWQATAERFRDEETGALVTVWFNSATGERRYVEQEDASPRA